MIFWYTFVTFIYFIVFITYKNIHLRFIPWIFLFVISALRYNVGSDYANYYQMYLYQDGMFEYKEWGYIKIVEILSYMNFNPQMMFVFFSFFTLILFYKGFDYLFKNNTDFLFATLLFIPIFYFYTLNGIRQSLAVAIFFFSIRYIVNKNFLNYFALIAIAILFHKSAIVLLPIYFFFNLKLTKFKLFIYYILLIVFVILNPLVYLGNFFVSNQLPLYYYFNDELAMLGVSGFGKISAIFMVIAILILSSVLNKEKSIQNIVFNMLLIFSFIKIVALEISFIDRFSLYFKPIIIVFLIYIARVSLEKIINIKRIVMIVMILISVSYTILVIYIRAISDESYNQYAMNLYLYGKNSGIVQICGDSQTVGNKE